MVAISRALIPSSELHPQGLVHKTRNTKSGRNTYSALALGKTTLLSMNGALPVPVRS